MNLIEQATRRMEELRRAGIHVPVAPTNADATVVQVAVGPRAEDVQGAAAVAPVEHVPEAVDDRSVGKTSREVTIDLKELAARGYLTPMLSDRALAEQIRVIKQAVLKNLEVAAQRGLRRNLVLVTSSASGEGKTFVSMNLAMSLAMEIDRHALLVDADVLRPSVLQRYGLEPSPGLMELAARSDLDISDVLLRTNVPKLSLLPAGQPDQKSPELLSSAYIDSLLTELSERYADRVVIFDAPPVLVSSGTRHLATRVGQVIMVVQADEADARTVTQAFEAVEACPIVSSVLNRSSLPDAGVYDYYAA
jgi:receptor protein-tyrosine kinase